MDSINDDNYKHTDTYTHRYGNTNNNGRKSSGDLRVLPNNNNNNMNDDNYNYNYNYT